MPSKRKKGGAGAAPQDMLQQVMAAIGGLKGSVKTAALKQAEKMMGESADWKSQLAHAVTKKKGDSLAKGELAYTVVEAEGGGFLASVCAPGLLSGEHEGSEPASTKKRAEHAAAKAAFIAEFQNCAAGTKRKAAGAKAAAATGPDPGEYKNRVHSALTLLLGRSFTKGECVYECEQVEDDSRSFRAELRVPSYDETLAWTGEPAPSKKMAESSAAQEAVVYLETLAAPLKAKKQKLAQEKKEVWLQEMAQKKLEKKAARAATEGVARLV